MVFMARIVKIVSVDCADSTRFGLAAIGQILACPPNFYGADCRELRVCDNGGAVDARFGRCVCAAGWIGDRCEFPCAFGQYSFNCAHFCNVVLRAED